MKAKRMGIICYRDATGKFIGSPQPIGDCAPPTEEENNEVDRALAKLFARELKRQVDTGEFAQIMGQEA